MSKDLKDKTEGELEEMVIASGRKKYLAGSIFRFIHSKGVEDVSLLTSLDKSFRAELAAGGYFISRLGVSRRLADPDGTVKFTFTLDDGGVIESVVLVDGKRRTLCISTQVGCGMNCVFCATGRLKLQRNLTAAEIAGQVYAVENAGERITNVVYMGMGEPLANYDAVLKSVRILNAAAGRNVGIRHLTVSTCGIAPAIKKLAGEDIHPRLAISLNAPSDELRSELMPINRKYPLKVLLDAVEHYQYRAKERVTFEYVLINGLNDSAEQAGKLVKLVRRFRCNVNLIEFNPHDGCRFKGSGAEQIDRFAEVVRGAGIETTVRLKMGSSIFAACGQLGAKGPKR
ncbi:MAG: 23S rRNA (adenine(2503)-C(2))-methyltransferase RlmN [Sedimentisphaerales bacterium]|nr:23S rRNA (adenine(2503)-C(2))-methyltransferase RlmN [Sedimentisphaerales bacterium]